MRLDSTFLVRRAVAYMKRDDIIDGHIIDSATTSRVLMLLI